MQSDHGINSIIEVFGLNGELDTHKDELDSQSKKIADLFRKKMIEYAMTGHGNEMAITGYDDLVHEFVNHVVLDRIINSNPMEDAHSLAEKIKLGVANDKGAPILEEDYINKLVRLNGCASLEGYINMGRHQDDKNNNYNK